MNKVGPLVLRMFQTYRKTPRRIKDQTLSELYSKMASHMYNTPHDLAEFHAALVEAIKRTIHLIKRDEYPLAVRRKVKPPEVAGTALLATASSGWNDTLMVKVSLMHAVASEHARTIDEYTRLVSWWYLKYRDLPIDELIKLLYSKRYEQPPVVKVACFKDPLNTPIMEAAKKLSAVSL